MANQVVWVDIPVLDLDRALRFYTAVLGKPLPTQDHGGSKVGLLPAGEGEVGGILFSKADERPSDQGILIYLNAQDRLDLAVAAVEVNGGKVLEPRHSIAPYGDRAVILDSEGNRVALHSM